MHPGTHGLEVGGARRSAHGAHRRHLDARHNWYRLFNDTIADFDLEEVGARQKAAFDAAGVPLPLQGSAS